ncbi:MAG: hydrogenase maturation nickel metallochaperone HypA [Anaerotardibacter sp.]
MHEVGIMTGVLEAVNKAACDAGALKVLKVSLSVGVMTEAIEDSLQFAFGILTENTICEGAELEIKMVQPKSLCTECGLEYSHDRFHVGCPECGSHLTVIIEGKELQIDSIEVDLPDDEDTEAESE